MLPNHKGLGLGYRKQFPLLISFNCLRLLLNFCHKLIVTISVFYCSIEGRENEAQYRLGGKIAALSLSAFSSMRYYAKMKSRALVERREVRRKGEGNMRSSATAFGFGLHVTNLFQPGQNLTIREGLPYISGPY